MTEMGDQNEFHIHTPPSESVIPGIWASALEDLGLVEVLAGYPDYSKHQRVRWLTKGFENLRTPTVTQSLAKIADELQQIRTLLTNGYATVHVTSQRDPR